MTAPHDQQPFLKRLWDALNQPVYECPNCLHAFEEPYCDGCGRLLTRPSGAHTAEGGHDRD